MTDKSKGQSGNSKSSGSDQSGKSGQKGTLTDLQKGLTSANLTSHLKPAKPSSGLKKD